jgi:hypothetical protein
MIIIYFLLLFQNYSEGDYVTEMFKEQNSVKIEAISNEGLKIYPNSYAINLNTGYRYLLLKEYKKAYPYYKKAYEIYPSLDALLGLTKTQLELNKYQELLDVTSTYKYKGENLEKWIHLRRSYAKKMNPKLSVDFIPIWGMINYASDNPDQKISYNYWGGAFYLGYDNYNLDLGYTNGTVEDFTETRVEHSLDFGMGYNKNYNIYLHFKKIFLENEDAMIPYLHFGYNFENMSLIGAFSVSSYEFLDNLLYQGSIYSYFYLFDKKIIPSIGAGYKYLKKDKTDSAPYFELGLNLRFIDELGLNALFRFNQHRYTVNYGGIVDNSLDDIAWMIEGGITLNFRGMIIKPIYRYYSIIMPPLENVRRGQVNNSSKSFFTILLGYEF